MLAPDSRKTLYPLTAAVWTVHLSPGHIWSNLWRLVKHQVTGNDDMVDGQCMRGNARGYAQRASLRNACTCLPSVTVQEIMEDIILTDSKKGSDHFPV